MWLLR